MSTQYREEGGGGQTGEERGSVWGQGRILATSNAGQSRVVLKTGRRRQRMWENWQCAECGLTLEIFALNSSCRQVWSRMREDIWRSVIFSLIVTSKEAQCFVLCLLAWEQPLTFMWGSRSSVPNCSPSTSLTFFSPSLSSDLRSRQAFSEKPFYR